jgi:hypothetical protein
VGAGHSATIVAQKITPEFQIDLGKKRFKILPQQKTICSAQSQKCLVMVHVILYALNSMMRARTSYSLRNGCSENALGAVQ